MATYKTKMLCSFISGIILSLIICMIIGANTINASANEKAESSVVPCVYSVYINGEETQLQEAFIKDGRTYVQLRELAGKTNMDVEWVDPKYHMLYAPGGGLPEGINVTNPTWIYVYDIVDFYNTSDLIQCVDITGIYEKYKENKGFKYCFSSDGLIIEENGQQVIKPLKYNPNSGRMYLEVTEFKEKVLPLLIEICLQ